ncbi:hypothetical protein LZ31DRAFT_233110 [Colletotrichum somersetense]|nr:hypothetical protein LZ31DRAFT_233110 [Colletotrichum somersetense]
MSGGGVSCCYALVSPALFEGGRHWNGLGAVAAQHCGRPGSQRRVSVLRESFRTVALIQSVDASPLPISCHQHHHQPLPILGVAWVSPSSPLVPLSGWLALLHCDTYIPPNQVAVSKRPWKPWNYWPALSTRR